MTADITVGREYGTDRPCEVGRVEYSLGVRDYVALTYRYTDGANGEKLPWFLTWVGEKGREAARLPEGVAPSAAMLFALDCAPVLECA